MNFSDKYVNNPAPFSIYFGCTQILEIGSNGDFSNRYQDDWLKTSASSLQLWEKAPFEPYALQKPVSIEQPSFYFNWGRLSLYNAIIFS